MEERSQVVEKEKSAESSEEDLLYLDRLEQAIRKFAEEMKKHLHEKAAEMGENKPAYMLELQKAGDLYLEQADEAVKLLREGEYDHAEAERVAGTFCMTNLKLRWTLEQRTTTFRKMMNNPSIATGDAIREAVDKINAGNMNIGFTSLLDMVEENKHNYPLMMTIGNIYLRKKNLTYAIRFFERAVQTPTLFDPNHYRNLALLFLAKCHEKNEHHTNALHTLLRMERVGEPEAQVLYNISRMYAQLGEEKKAISYFNRALRKRPEFFALGLVDEMFIPISDSIDLEFQRHTEEFSELASAIEKMVSKILQVSEYLDPENTPKEVILDGKIARKTLKCLQNGNYSSYRKGIIDFYKGAFPEIIDDVTESVFKRSNVIEGIIQKTNTGELAKLSRSKTFYSPAIGIAAGVLAFLCILLVQHILPSIQISFLPYLVSGLSIGLSVYLANGYFTNLYHSRCKNEGYVEDIRLGARQVQRMKEKLLELWNERISNEVEETMPWSDSDNEEQGVFAEKE